MIHSTVSTYIPTSRPAPTWQHRVDTALDVMRDRPATGEELGSALADEGRLAGDSMRTLHGELVIAHALFWQNRMEEAEKLFDRLENDATRLGSLNGQWLARLGLMMIWRTHGKTRHAYDHVVACGDLPAPGLLSPKVALLLYNCVGIVCQECVQTEDALRYFYTALDIARATALPSRVAHVSMNIGELFYICGNAEDGEVMLAEAHRLSQLSEERWLRPFVAAVYALCLIALHRDDDAYDVMAPLVGERLSLHSPHVPHQAFFLSVAAYVVATRGHLDEAEGLCAESLALLDQFEESQLKPYTWWVNGHLLHRRGRLDEASAALQRAIEDVGDLGYVFMPMRASEELMHIRAKQQNWQGAYREQLRFQALFARSHSDATRTRVQIMRIETELREAENARRAAERATDAKSLHLATMSNEIRTPMNAVMGMAYLLMRTELSAEQREYAQNILDAGLQLLGTLNDVLDVSKIEAGRLELEHLEFSLSEVFERVSAIAESALKGKDVLYLIEGLEAVDERYRGDPLRLGQILINLVTNAIKFTTHGSITVRCIELARSENGVQLQFSVIDSGVGMTTSEQGRLFEPVSQNSVATARRFFGGRGLGLSIVQRLAQMMGGDVSVQSREGEGSVFTVTVWLENVFADDGKAVLPAEDDETAPVPRFEGIHILVAEDNAISRQIAAEMLSAAGASFDFALDGRQAVARVLAAGPQGYHAVLMDIQMPEMDGVEATRVLRATPGFSGLPIIAMTAHALAAEREQYRRGGMTDHIAKPVDPKVFYKTLGKWLSVPTLVPATELGGPISHQIEMMPGLDTSKGLARVAGNIAVYTKLLELFSSELSDTLSEMGRVFPDNLERAGQLAHRLKGSSGSVGALGVHAAALEMELEVRRCVENSQVDLDDECLENLRVESDIFLASLAQALGAPSVAGAANVRA